MTVHLIGVGPGEADLMTLRAARLLGQADAVVFDRLIGADVLDYVSPTAERYDVGKTPGLPGPAQDDINELLVQLGTRLDAVVRVKGGDPTVFGRAAEEAEACRAAGVSVDLVPGISSSVAAPTAAGISVTRRGVSSGFCVVTAHQDPASDAVDWDALGRCGLSLVVLMGARRAAAVRDALLAGGRSGTTPVAIVTNACRPDQATRRLSLSELGVTPVANPSVIVIGEVAADAHRIALGETIAAEPVAARNGGEGRRC